MVIPILKPGKDKNCPSSYRPISLTSVLCKVMERMISRRLVWYLEKHSLLTPQQCGFRQGRSSTDHLVALEDAIQNAFLSGQYLAAVFFDIEKAYDTAWRRGILNTLKEWGIEGNMLAFVQNFLSNRSFFVRVGTAMSSRCVLENGVPQGSVTLFAVAINNIVQSVHTPVSCMLMISRYTLHRDL